MRVAWMRGVPSAGWGDVVTHLAAGGGGVSV